MTRLPSPSRPPAHRQQGIVLVFALITLVILLIGAVAISRSISSNQLAIGNIGFKRDLSNQGELALEKALKEVRAGGLLATVTTRNTDLQAANYSATLLPTTAQGIPNALLVDALFNAVGTSANDIDITDMGVKVRYVIDRVASATGTCSSSTCTLANQVVFGGNSAEWINSQNSSGNGGTNPGAVPQQPIYRVSVRVTGPRNTMSFFQSTFTTD